MKGNCRLTPADKRDKLLYVRTSVQEMRGRLKMSDNVIKLEDQVCFSIYACSREITRLYRPMLEQMGLTYPQYLVLLVLWEKQECTVKDLGELLYLDSGTLTPLLKRMQESGLVTRQRSPEDERKVLIRLTETGYSLKEKVKEIPAILSRKCGIDKEELDSIREDFYKLLKRVSDVNNRMQQR